MLPIVAVAKLVVLKMAEYKGRPGGRRFRRSRLELRNAAQVQYTARLGAKWDFEVWTHDSDLTQLL